MRCRIAMNAILKELPETARGGIGPANAFYDFEAKTLILFDLEPFDSYGSKQYSAKKSKKTD